MSKCTVEVLLPIVGDGRLGDPHSNITLDDLFSGQVYYNFNRRNRTYYLRTY